MNKVYPLLTVLVMFMALQSCSKKSHPTTAIKNSPTEPISKTATDSSVVNTDTSLTAKKSDSLLTAKPAVKKKAKESVPKVITVNDKFASKSVDGRYYYDLQGHRYWRNNNDGKYYLFNKSMLNDEAFKKPQ